MEAASFREGERSRAINPYLAALLLITTALVQSSVMPDFALRGMIPDLMLLVVVSWSLLRGPAEGLGLALSGGVLLDLFSGGPVAAATISLPLASMATTASQNALARGFIWLPLAASVLATTVYDAIYLLILRIAGRPIAWGPSFLQVVLPAMVLNALLMYPIYWLMRRLHRRLHLEQIE